MNVVGLVCIAYAHLSNSASQGSNEEEANKNLSLAMLGLGLIAFGQIFISFQVIIEEKFLTGYDMDAEMAAGMTGF